MATSNRNERVRFRYGLCLNDECSKCKTKEVQQIAARKDFVCAECGKPLRECPPPKSFWDKNGKKIIAAAILVIAAIAAACIFLIPGGKTEPQADVDSVKTDSVKADTGIVETPAPVVEEPKPAVEETKPAVETPKPVVKQPLNGRGKVNLGYGIYEGDLKNGQPHGYGTITYTQQHKIVSSKDFIANPGDTFEGDFRDGRISGQGYWTHDGNQTVVKP